MISLKDLLLDAGLNCPEPRYADISIQGITTDSKKVKPHDLFIAVRGIKADGHDFIPEAIAAGAAAVVIEKEITSPENIPFVRVLDGRKAVADLASAFYKHPSKSLRVIGITGTNGKTTSSYLLEYLLQAENQKTGVLGTVNYRCGDWSLPAVETTPGPLRIQEILSEIKKRQAAFAVMEVSSHALDQQRVGGIYFEAALFTNLTQDHLDYHGNMENYFQAKAKLFTNLGKDKTAVLNADDAWTEKIKKKTISKILTYGIDSPADLKAENIRWEKNRTVFTLRSGNSLFAVESPLIGTHNVYNVLGAFGIMSALGFDLKSCVEKIKNFKGVPGRLERVDAGQEFLVFVDFAHTPDGLQNVLTSLLPYKNKKLITVFGCGGDRDKGKRPKMGSIAGAHCDFVYVTADNPRSEDPKAIAAEIQKGFPEGFKNFSVIVDRKKAIRQALLSARKDDIVVLAGKGHETTQVFSDKTIPFSDREEAERVLRGN